MSVYILEGTRWQRGQAPSNLAAGKEACKVPRGIGLIRY